MESLIKREDAIKAIAEYFSDDDDSHWNAIATYIIKDIPSAEKQGEWIPCSERLPDTDNKNDINEYDVLLLVRAKKHPERTPQVYIGKLRHVKGDDGSGNFWGIKTEPCDWTIWGWSYFQEPEVLAWMPLPPAYEGE